MTIGAESAVPALRVWYSCFIPEVNPEVKGYTADPNTPHWSHKSDLQSCLRPAGGEKEATVEVWTHVVPVGTPPILHQTFVGALRCCERSPTFKHHLRRALKRSEGGSPAVLNAANDWWGVSATLTFQFWSRIFTSFNFKEIISAIRKAVLKFVSLITC